RQHRDGCVAEGQSGIHGQGCRDENGLGAGQGARRPSQGTRGAVPPGDAFNPEPPARLRAGRPHARAECRVLVARRARRAAAACATATGQLPDKEGQMYETTPDRLFAVPTAEVPLTNFFRDEILEESALPVRRCAYTPCFRREAGSYGKDVRGLNRVHQFDKVEIVQLVHPAKSYDVLEEMVAHIEKLIQSLGLHYRILLLCGGDMSFASAITYDFELYSAD